MVTRVTCGDGVLHEVGRSLVMPLLPGRTMQCRVVAASFHGSVPAVWPMHPITSVEGYRSRMQPVSCHACVSTALTCLRQVHELPRGLEGSQR